MTVSDRPKGIPPVVTAESKPFWDGATRGELVVEQCATCQLFVFPARGVCAGCGGRALSEVSVEGPGRIHSFTVNHNAWLAGMEVPYVLALVEFPDYPGFRILGRLRTADIGAVAIDDEVQIGFEPGPRGLSIPSFLLGGEK